MHTDGYSGYDFLDQAPDIVHIGCWAHVRRKFVDVIKAAGKGGSEKKSGIADEAVARIGELYAIEQEARSRNLEPAAIRQLVRCGVRVAHAQHGPVAPRHQGEVSRSVASRTYR